MKKSILFLMLSAVMAGLSAQTLSTYQKFADKDNVVYFLDPASTTTALNINGGITMPMYKELMFGSTSNFLKINNAGSYSKIEIGNSSLAISVGTTPIMTFSSSGVSVPIKALGIGTTNPSYKLHVVGSIYSNSGIMRTDGTFQVGPSGNRFVVNSNGNVGIGTTGPDCKLDVNGKIRCEVIEVISDVPASDFVFENDYNLLTLNDLELFVNENKHLPDVPSANDFKKNGYKVGEMDDLLLRKIEELTLYIIELKKENTELANRINKLEE